MKHPDEMTTGELVEAFLNQRTASRIDMQVAEMLLLADEEMAHMANELRKLRAELEVRDAENWSTGK